MKLKTIIARLALLWILVAQMVYVSLSAASGPNSLSRLEANYAFAPSADRKAALDREFERVASYESHRAIARYTLLLAIDVALIALFWNFGMKRQAAAVSTATPAGPSLASPVGTDSHPLPGQLSAS